MNKFFSSAPLWETAGLFLIRIVVGYFMIYHGWEVFSEEKMKPYFDWDAFKGFSSPKLIVYTGKTAELVAGIFLTIGLFTRLASLVLIFTMLYISFFVGHGDVRYQDQHPFLFVLLGLVFFFTGSGKWSVDQFLLAKRK